MWNTVDHLRYLLVLSFPVIKVKGKLLQLNPDKTKNGLDFSEL
jgi:hypothetical protein